MSMFRHVVYGILSILMVLSVGYGIWYTTRLPFFTISTVSVRGGETVSHDEVRTRTEKELSGSYLFLIPHRFAYLYPYDQIMQVVGAIPRIRNVSVVSVARNGLLVSFDEYIPHALWCQGERKDSPCYFIDSSGYAFAPAPLLEGGALIRYIVLNEDTLREGYIIEKDALADSNQFATILSSELGFRVSTVLYTVEGDVVYSINGGGKLLTAPSVGIEETYENLTSLLESDDFSHLEPGNFNYIDLRFGNKVFVNEEFATATSTEENEEPHVDAAQMGEGE